MASKSRSKSSKKAGKNPAKRASPAKQAAKKSGDHVRMMPDKKLILSLSKEMDLTLKRSSVLSGEFGQSMRDAKERGVNLVAFRLAKRFHRKAVDDPLGASILWEDFQYVMETLEFEKMIAPSMFPPVETRSGKKSTAKNGKKGGNDKQIDMADTGALPPPEGAEGESPAVH